MLWGKLLRDKSENVRFRFQSFDGLAKYHMWCEQQDMQAAAHFNRCVTFWIETYQSHGNGD